MTYDIQYPCTQHRTRVVMCAYSPLYQQVVKQLLCPASIAHWSMRVQIWGWVETCHSSILT